MSKNTKVLQRTISKEYGPSKNGHHPILSKVFAARGVDVDEELDRPMQKLLSFKDLKGIDAAVSVIYETITSGGKITVLGDFDTDGATSTALTVKTLSQFGCDNVDFVIPNRVTHGYGLSVDIANHIIESNKPDLVITVDNGITSIDGVSALKSHGIKVVITDHHLVSGVMPDADAIVNPNQPGCNFQSKNLAGVGVAFYVLVGLRRYLHEHKWFEKLGCRIPVMSDKLDLVALGTVADVVKLDRNNRLLVHHGLNVIANRRACVGISALLAIGRRDQSYIIASDLSYCVGPRLNAAGRIADGSIGVKCLLTDCPIEADKYAEHLNSLNLERRQMELDMQDKASDMLSNINFDDQVPSGICLYDPSWHQGVIGILASRVKEQFHRPCIIFTKSEIDGTLKGSGRSLAKLNIRDAIYNISNSSSEIVKKFGGHAMAAGLSIDESRFDEFNIAFNQYISENLTMDDLESVLYTDGILANDYISLDFAKLIKSSGPWGQGFVEPIFEGRFYIADQRIVGNNHLKLLLELDDFSTVNAIMFNADTSQWPNSNCEEATFVFKLDINEYRGRQQVQLIIETIQDLKISESV